MFDFSKSIGPDYRGFSVKHIFNTFNFSFYMDMHDPLNALERAENTNSYKRKRNIKINIPNTPSPQGMQFTKSVAQTYTG